MNVYQKPDAIFIELTPEEEITVEMSTPDNEYDDFE